MNLMETMSPETSRDQAARQSGIDPASRFFHFESGTCLALNVPARTVTVASGASVRTYMFDDICEWASRSERPGVEAQNGGQLANGVEVEAIGAGLFLSVKDRDCPTWRIAMQDKAKREQWFEILARVFTNGGVARAQKTETKITRKTS